MNEEEEDTVAEMEPRAVKITPQAMEERLQRVVNLRKAKLAKLTGTVKQVRQLMENECDASLAEATHLMKDFNERFGEFCDLNTNVKEVLQQMPEEDLTKDQEKWFEPKADSFKAFAETASAWIDKMAMRAVEAEKCNEDVDPSDSISNASVSKRSDKAFSERGSCASSSVSSTRMKAEVERATLLIKASSLRQKRLLEEREAKLQAEKEELEIQTALAANEAKIKILSEYESRASKASSRVSTRDGMNSYVASHRVGNLFTSQQSNSPSPTRERQAQKKNILQNAQQTHTVTSQLPQTPSALQDVVEVLTKQQKLATLPPQNISVFKGDPLEYRLFMRAFEHGVEDRTESDKDRLYYMEHCLHMEPTHGYQTAKRLLEEHFGNAYKISVAYIHKALNWPTIKSDDGEALHAFGLYLTGCQNAMMDVEYMEELDNTANMRAIVSKLPYKLRERWRTFACGTLDKEKRRVKFADLAEFVNKQAKEVLHPLFGDIKDSTLKVQVRGQVDERLQRRSGIRKGFTTAATITTTQDVPSKERNKVSGNQVCAFSKPCLFCRGEEHTMEQCKRMRKSLHKEKIDFMRTKGLCFSCLKQGHMSMLHMKTKPNATSKRAAPEVESLEREDQTESIVNGFVEMEAPAHDAEKTEHILAIVPVQVKPKRGQKVTHTYAFLDPGSTACFCTEELMHELNLTGRKTNILLKTMGEEKVVSSHIVSGLEISSLDSDDFFELPEMYSHSDIPASADNAPSQDYVNRWTYLQQVSIPRIEAKIGLLIGANAPKAVEPWQVIASKNGGPYAVKTRLGWTISEPLQGSSSQRAACGLIQVAANRISVSKLDELWDQQFKSDFPECERNEKQEMSREDLQFLEIATESATIVDGHYSIALPLQNKRIKMPNNRKVAEQRALHLKRKLERNTPFHAEYSAFMSNIITKGYAVKVPEKDLGRDDGKVWYLPHHGVYHPKKHKLRVVFDCGASYKGTTLNDQLLQGPNLTSTLLGVIIRFRQEEVAIMADVEAMFHQVKVPDEDSDLLRFLWWTSGDITQKMVEYKMVVHIFGATSSPSCASFALRKCAEDNRDPANSQAVDTVLHNFYVDDCLKAVSSEEEAIQLYHTLRAVCQRGGFRLTKWISNSRAVLSAIPEEEVHPVEGLTIDDPEVKGNLVCASTIKECEDVVLEFLQYFSSWFKLKRAVAWMLKVKSILLQLCRKRKELSAVKAQPEVERDMKGFKDSLFQGDTNKLTVENLAKAEEAIIRYCQRKTFPKEITALSKGQGVKRTSSLFKLSPVLEQGILRVGGRLSRAALPEESKRPAILNKDLHITKLILREIHENLAHCGHNHVISKLRTKFWVPGANSAVRKILARCIACRREHGVAGQQQMADLPRDRVLPDDPPFTNCGVDYFGPYEIKRGRSTVKRYGVIFTCLTTRAIHLEMAASLDTDSFIHALRRFIARRGQIKILRSDNRTNFIGAERELKRAIAEWNVSKIEDHLKQQGIQWTFNPPSGPHHGGVWERLLKSVKKILNVTLRLQTLDEESLHTLLCEAEAIINSRPITKASSDPNDLEVLTPNHLLLLRNKPSLPPGLFDRQDLYARRRWKQVQYMSEIFWKRWAREYLPQLQERQRWTRPSRNFLVGDIVLIVDDTAPRNSWITGKVIHTISDKAGMVRQVRIKTKTSVLDGPITKICLLQESD
ncbi:hypothetical protein ACER0C_003351 [Sarotherodon galilaeus]